MSTKSLVCQLISLTSSCHDTSTKITNPHAATLRLVACPFDKASFLNFYTIFSVIRAPKVNVFSNSKQKYLLPENRLVLKVLIDLIISTYRLISAQESTMFVGVNIRAKFLGQ